VAGAGCCAAALAGEIARGGKRTRALLTEEIRTNLQLIEDLIPSKDEGQARSRAILTYSALVGAIGLARAVSLMNEQWPSGSGFAKYVTIVIVYLMKFGSDPDRLPLRQQTYRL